MKLVLKIVRLTSNNHHNKSRWPRLKIKNKQDIMTKNQDGGIEQVQKVPVGHLSAAQTWSSSAAVMTTS